MFGSDLFIFKKEIGSEFEMKDLGDAELLLGVRVNQLHESIELSQAHCVESILHEYDMTDCKMVLSPVVPGSHLESPLVDEVRLFKETGHNYRTAVGSLSYLATATRPDLSFAVSMLSQYLENPGIQHWRAFIHVLKYLRGTMTVCLSYPKEHPGDLVAYSDADWGNCRSTRRSVTGYLAILNGCLIVWRLRKQPTVSLSTAEAEYQALTDLSCELLWLR